MNAMLPRQSDQMMRSVHANSWRSRRQLGLSHPFHLSAIVGAVLIGVLIGLTLLYRIAAADLSARDEERMAANSRILNLELSDFLGAADTFSKQLDETSRDLSLDNMSPEHRRAYRRLIAQQLAPTPFEGAVVMDSQSRILTSVISSGLAAKIGQPPASGLFPDANVLDDGPVLYSRDDVLFIATKVNGVRLLAIAESSHLSRRLMVSEDIHAFLTDKSGRVISTSPGAPDIARMVSVQNWMTPAHSGEVRFAPLRVADETRPVSSQALTDWGANLYLVGPKADLERILSYYGLLFLAMSAPAALALILAISLIQNEWSRHDRRASASDDVVARADIACEALSAGIIDWNTVNAAVSYSRGWCELIQSDARSAPQDEEIFDWIQRIHPEDRQAVRSGYQTLLDGRETAIEQAFRVRMADGEYGHFTERAVARRGEGERPSRIVLVQTKNFIANIEVPERWRGLELT